MVYHQNSDDVVVIKNILLNTKMYIHLFIFMGVMEYLILKT